MKTLKQFCDNNSLTLAPIRYRHQFGYCKRKGFDILAEGGFILASFEPCEYSNGDKWYLRHTHEGYNGPRYVKRITPKVLANINPAAKSFFVNSSFSN